MPDIYDPTKERAFKIGLLGNFGSGKSDLAKAMTTTCKQYLTKLLGDSTEIIHIREQTETGPVGRALRGFYDEKEERSELTVLRTELAFLYMRAGQEEEIAIARARARDGTTSPKIIIGDPELLQGPEVATARAIRANEMSSASVASYQEFCDFIFKKINLELSDLIVYVKTPVAVCHIRDQKRAGEFGTQISKEYLQKMEEAYTHFGENFDNIINKYRKIAIVPPDIKLIVVDRSEDIEENPTHLNNLIKNVITPTAEQMINARNRENSKK